MGVTQWKLVRRGFAGLASLALSAVLSAQGEAWQTYADTWRQASHAPLTLLVPDTLPISAHQVADDQFLMLTRGWDVGVDALTPPDFAMLRQARGWPAGPRWVLLDREGRAVAEGVSLPTGATLRDHLLGLGLQPTWEALEQFLIHHPDSGSALDRRLMIACRMSTARFRLLRSQGQAEGFTGGTGNRWPAFRPATVAKPEAVAGISREVVETLHRLNQLPDAWRTDRDMFTFWLTMLGSLDGPALQPEVALLRESVFKVWQTHPHTGAALVPEAHGPGVEGLSRLWLVCQSGTNTLPELGDLARMQPSPERLWPPFTLLQDIAAKAMELQQPRELLAFLDQLPEPSPAEAALPDGLTLRGSMAFWRMAALTELNRWPEAMAALQEVRRLAGPQWRESVASLKPIYGPLEAPPQSSKPLPPKPPPAPAEFLEVLELPPLEPPAPPAAPKHLRLLIWGKPNWAEGWAALRNSPDLAPWGPEELRLEIPTEADARRLQKAQLPVHGWAVFRGETDIVVTGLEAPDPTRLALQLRAVAPARIQQLDAFLAKHPEQLDARWDRYTLARARMPLAALEGRLLEDAVAATIPVDFGPEAPWLLNPEKWRFQARRMVPELAAALRRWPANRSLWQAWIAWSAFLPVPPSVVAFAEGLPVFGPRTTWKLLLPGAVHWAVAAEFRKTRRFGLMADWFREPWLNLVAPPQERPAELPSATESEAAIHEGYLEALKGLKQTVEAADAEHRWRQARSPAVARKP
ncbi:MAG: hypothetical protein ACOYNX_10690 [Geothrix sp.]